MGSAFRGAVIAGPEDGGDRARAVACPRCSATSTPTRPTILADPNGEIIVTDGRNHLELTTETYDIIVTDPPPPIFSSGASVISSLEYYQAGHARLNPGGVMMQWIPYGATIDEFKAHVRTFRSVFQHIDDGVRAWRLRAVHDGLGRADDATTRRRSERSSARPGILEDISTAYDSPAKTVDGWITQIDELDWIDDERGRRVHRLGAADHGRPSAARVLPAPAPLQPGRAPQAGPGELLLAPGDSLHRRVAPTFLLDGHPIVATMSA